MLERLLMQAVGAGDAGAIEPALAETLAAQARASADEQEAVGLPAVLLVPAPLRLLLSRFLRRSVPSLRVLSHAEVPDSKGIRVSAVLGAR
jgi:flagellar biosynthesis protein FlhA